MGLLPGGMGFLPGGMWFLKLISDIINGIATYSSRLVLSSAEVPAWAGLWTWQFYAVVYKYYCQRIRRLYAMSLQVTWMVIYDH